MSSKLAPSPAQARILVELHRGSLVVMGDRFARWHKGSGNARAGKPLRSTVVSLARAGWIEPEDTSLNLWRISEAGTSVAAGISADAVDPRPSKLGMTSYEVAKILANRHPFPEWVTVPEVPLGALQRSVDLLALSRSRVVAYEIKVSRSDFLRDAADPEKRRPALEWFSQFYFAAPSRLVDPGEIPDGCGLVEVEPSGGYFETRYAPMRQCDPPDWSLVLAIARSLVRRLP